MKRLVIIAVMLAASAAASRAQPVDAGSGGGSGPGSVSGPGSGSGSGSGGKLLQLPDDVRLPEVAAAAYPTAVRLGDRLTLYVTATFTPGVIVNLREPLSLGPAFEVGRKTSEDRPNGDGRTTREWQIEVTAWEVGDLQIAPIAVTFTVAGRVGQLETNAVPLKIFGELGDMVDDPRTVRGLAAPAGMRIRDWFWIWVAAAAAGAAGVLGTALWLRAWRRRRRGRRLVGRHIARPVRIDMTSERALEQLLAIEQAGTLDRDADRKLGYARMSAIVRAYLGARYRCAVHDRTSAELLADLAARASAEHRALAGRWIAPTDLIKYGGGRATAAEAHQALADARSLIVATTPAREAA
ncbi:MAG TPA: BatD family protein [Kofleriaceae bacterium]